MRTPLLALLAALLALGGCKMIDQRTFQRTPAAPSPAALSRSLLAPLPIARLQPASPESGWRAQLDAAVREALARNPDTHFDVMTPIPTAASRTIQDGYERAGTLDAQTVAAALQQDGVDAAHITIGFQGDGGKPAREVRLYTR